MAKNFPKLVMETGIQVQEAQKVPIKTNLQGPTEIHYGQFVKERFLEGAKEKQLVTYRETP